MTLGEKIKELRIENGITQEELSEKLNVSRSAIAKWESDSGIPELFNLKMISDCFSVSVDSLIDGIIATDHLKLKYENKSNDIGKIFDIELFGYGEWICNALLCDEDDDFYYYQQKPAKFLCNSQMENGEGIIGKKHIKMMSLKKKDYNVDDIQIDRNYFCNKLVNIEVEESSFFDFINDDYQGVIIKTFTNSMVVLENGRELNISDIRRIEKA